MSSEKSGTPLVQIKDLSIAFGGIKAVDKASVDLHPGEVVAILGPQRSRKIHPYQSSVWGIQT